MSHRLLHTLVFASTSLLACGGTIEELPDVEPQPDATPKKDASPPPEIDASVPDVAPEAQAEAEAEAEPPEDAGSDVRTCEGGWPTTKGQICTFDAGIVCCTASWGDDAGPICCEKNP